MCCGFFFLAIFPRYPHEILTVTPSPFLCLCPFSQEHQHQQSFSASPRRNWQPARPLHMHNSWTAERYGHQKHFDFDVSNAVGPSSSSSGFFAARGGGVTTTKPPPGFAHPGGFAEEPKREGCISNFGAGGVRHCRRKMAPGHQVAGSLQASMKFGGGGLGPDNGVPIRYGHANITGATSPECDNQRRFAGLRQHSSAFGDGLAPAPGKPEPPPPPQDPMPWATDDNTHLYYPHGSAHAGQMMTRTVIEGGEAQLDPFGRAEGFQYSNMHAGRSNISSHRLFRNPESCPPTPPDQESMEYKWRSGTRKGEYSPHYNKNVTSTMSGEDGEEGGGGGGGLFGGMFLRGEQEKRRGNRGGGGERYGGGGGGGRGAPPPPTSKNYLNGYGHGYAGKSSEVLGADAQGGGPKKTFPSRNANTFETVGVTPKSVGVPDDVEPEKRSPPRHSAGAPSEPRSSTGKKIGYSSREVNTFETVGCTPKSLGVPDDVEPVKPSPPHSYSAGAPSDVCSRDSVGKKSGYAERQMDTFETVGKTMVLLNDRGEPLGSPRRSNRTSVPW